MRFVKTPKHSSSLATTKGTYVNSKGRVTHHPRISDSPIEFIGIDGEGITSGSTHKYVLLGCGDKQFEDVDGIYWRDAFSFLYSNYRRGVAFVGFYLGYDFTQILKTLPEDKAWMLLTAEGRALRKHRLPGKPPHPVMVEGWHCDLLANKRLRIRTKNCDCPVATCGCQHSPWMYICDAGGFFQSSFLTVIDPRNWNDGDNIVGDSEFADIREGKERRSTAVLDDDMRRYNRLENQVLARVMHTLDMGLHDIGIHLPPQKWFGPGQAAQAWLKKIDAPTRVMVQETVPAWFLEAARAAYFGGWFEIMMHGIIPGDSHEYDINSAYPEIIRTLPCLLHGKYTHGEGMPSVRNGNLCLVYAQLHSKGDPRDSRHGTAVGVALHRDTHGRILRPLATEGWFWYDEVQSAVRASCVSLRRSRFLKWVKYEPCDCPPPMRTIANLYLRRLEVGKKTPRGKAAKLVYNSGYGKFAQSIGDPIFGDPVYASRITSGTRRMILDAIATHPNGVNDVAMVATDAVYFLTRHPRLPISDALGEWDYQIRSNLTLFKPGVYWDDRTREQISNSEPVRFKARGFRASDLASHIGRIDDTFRSWRDRTPGEEGDVSDWEWPSVSFVPSFSMTTALQALRRGKWQDAGRVELDPKPVVQDSNPEDKRWGIYRDGDIFRSRPYPGLSIDGEVIPSTPYSKRFGMEDPFSEEYRSQYGETQDGSTLDVLRWLLNPDA